MVAKAELAEINEILNPQADEQVAETKPDEVVEEVVENADEVEETEADEVVETVEEVAEGDKTYTPAEFAESVGWETDDIYNGIVIPMKDGENIPLGELKNKYQDISNDNASLKTQINEVKSQAEQAQTGANQGQQLSQAMIEQMGYLSSINRTEQGTDWAELESLDPSDAVLQRDKIRRAREEVQGNMNLLQQQEQQMKQQFIQQARTQMLELIPEWKDEAVRDKDQESMRVTMRGFGFNDNETNNIVDPRQMKILRRLSQLEAKDKQATSAVKKVKAAPKTLKGRTAKPVTNGDQENKLIKRAQSSGNKSDQMAAMKAILKNG